jgi:hypothetical protein
LESTARPSPIRWMPLGEVIGIAYARYTTLNLGISSLFGVSHESRSVLLSRGYRTWKMYSTGGHTRTIFWNPDVDFVLFPPDIINHRGNSIADELYLSTRKFFTLVGVQYPEEAKIAKNMAMCSSHASRSMLGSHKGNFFKKFPIFKTVKKLIVVVERQVEEARVWSCISKVCHIISPVYGYGIFRRISKGGLNWANR